MSIACSSTVVACHFCGDESRWLKHHVCKYLGTIKTLCSDCVIHLHAPSLCPFCFTNKLIASNVVVLCVRCYSSSHVTCIGSYPNAPYLCVTCLYLDTPLLIHGDLNGRKVVDTKAARVLLAASKISADSMKKAAMDAKVEAEVKFKEAIESRKLATEAVEHVEHLTIKS